MLRPTVEELEQTRKAATAALYKQAADAGVPVPPCAEDFGPDLAEGFEEVFAKHQVELPGSVAQLLKRVSRLGEIIEQMRSGSSSSTDGSDEIHVRVLADGSTEVTVGGAVHDEDFEGVDLVEVHGARAEDLEGVDIVDVRRTAG